MWVQEGGKQVFIHDRINVQLLEVKMHMRAYEIHNAHLF